MPTTRFRTAGLVLLAGLTIASSCAPKIPAQQFPPVADLTVQPEPKLDPAALNSDKALNDYQAERDAWGTAGWLQVGRLCRWAEQMGAKGLSCPAPEPR